MRRSTSTIAFRFSTLYPAASFEGALYPPDDPTAATPLVVTAGAMQSSIDIILNGELSHNAVSGLALRQLVRRQDAGLKGFDGVGRIAMSPDGAHLYVIVSPEDSVYVFTRNPTTGELAFVERQTDGVGVVTHMRQPVSVVVSPDGAHVYVASREGAIVSFSRNATTGALTFIEADVDTNFLEAALGLAISPDGRSVYAASPRSDSVEVFARDAGTGRLTYVEVQQDGVGGLTELDNALGVVVSPDNAHVYVIGGRLPYGGAINVFGRNPLSGALTFVQTLLDDAGGVNGLDGALSIAITPDGKSVYVGCSSEEGDGIGVFARDVSTGTLTFVENEVGATPTLSVSPYFTDGMPTVAVSADGTRVYGGTTEKITDTNLRLRPGRKAVVALDRDPSTGRLVLISGEGLGEGVSDILESPDGRHVYAHGAEHLGVYRPTTLACTAMPQPTCRAPFEPGRGVLKLKDKVPFEGFDLGKRDSFEWKWDHGLATAVSEFGAPVTAPDDLVLCLYDQSAAPQPVFTALLAGQAVCGVRPCWKPAGRAGAQRLQFADPLGKPHGVGRATFREGPDGKAKITVKGKGLFVPMPGLPLLPPVRAQLQAANGTCWEATYSMPDRNDLGGFEAHD